MCEKSSKELKILECSSEFFAHILTRRTSSTTTKETLEFNSFDNLLRQTAKRASGDDNTE
jgi:hypothetical protein